MSVLLNKVKSETNSSLRYIKKFCDENSVKFSLRSFLFYKKQNSSIPQSVYYFFGGNYSKYYFYNSKLFYEYYNSLQPDFRRDVTSVEELLQVQRLTLATSELHTYVSSLLKQDYVHSEVR